MCQVIKSIGSILLVILVFFVLNLLSGCFGIEKKKEPEKSNIIYILADDLGYAELGCYGQEKIEGQRTLKGGTKTIGKLLQITGYKTGIVEKWELGAPLTEGIPNKQGFDFFYGFNCQRQAHTFFCSSFVERHCKNVIKQ